MPDHLPLMAGGLPDEYVGDQRAEVTGPGVENGGYVFNAGHPSAVTIDDI